MRGFHRSKSATRKTIMSSANACRTLVLSLLLAASPALAQPKSPPEKLGSVTFANSCQPAVQASLERAVALLHSFWFREAERAFRETWAADPQCAIAGWGIASSLIGNTFAVGPNPQQAQVAKEAIERARAA